MYLIFIFIHSNKVAYFIWSKHLNIVKLLKLQSFTWIRLFVCGMQNPNTLHTFMAKQHSFYILKCLSLILCIGGQGSCCVSCLDCV